MTSTARFALLAATISVVLTAAHSRAEAWSCDLYYDATPFPRWDPVGTDCSLLVLHQYSYYQTPELLLEVLIGEEWTRVDRVASSDTIELTTWYDYCSDPSSCTYEGYDEHESYDLFTIEPAERLPSNTAVRVVVVDSPDTVDVIAEFTTGDESIPCMSPDEIPEPYCSGAPCEYEYPDECGYSDWVDDWDDGDSDDGDDDDDGLLDFGGCSAANGSGSGSTAGLLMLFVVAIRRTSVGKKV